MEAKARTYKQIKEEVVVKLNGKIVYTLLSLLIALVAWIGNGIVDQQKINTSRLEEVRDSFNCLKGDFTAFKTIHNLEHEELEDEMHRLHDTGRPTLPTDPHHESSSKGGG